MANSKRWKLHYGGETYYTKDESILDEIAGTEGLGTIKFRLEDDRWMTITTGPGIPISLEETKPPAVPHRIR